MNILELNFQSGWRGGERQTIYTIEGFRNSGIKVHLVCKRNCPLELLAKKKGFIVHSFKTVWGVVGFLISNGRNYNFIHAQTSDILTYCVLCKPFFKAKILFTRRVNFIQKGFFTKLKYHFTDRIIAVSPAIKETLTKFTKRKDIEIISDIGVKSEPNLAAAKEMIAPLQLGSKFIIASTSALSEDKDPLTGIDAVKKLLKKRNDFVFLHFGGGQLKDDATEAIKKDNLQSVYFLMGFVENVDDFFPLFEIFVMTSSEEGLGSSVLDAFLNKVPVVSTNAGGLRELLGNDRGIVCDVKDSDALTEGINYLLQNPDKKQEYINNAYNYAVNYHSMKFITDQYIHLMKSYAIIK